MTNSNDIRAAMMRRGGGRNGRQGFSLIELLVVIAISSIILFLLFGPIIQSFNLTRRARAISQAQDAARFGINRVVQELSTATYVYDNGGVKVAVPMQGAAPRGEFAFAGYNLANPATWPQISYARIDLVPTGTRDPNGVIDPTTGRSVQGVEVRPQTRGRRVVRYFVGLRNPVAADGTQGFYENVYEFRRDDNNFNPLILYRAEFDPEDPRLFNMANYSSAVVESGGFNDPAFFYNRNTASNGRTYAENWRQISTPVVNSLNLDLTIWNRDPQRQVRAGDPFKVAISFTPSAVSGDTATPGFLNNEAAEQPFAVPTLYSTKYGAWTYPYRITFLRGATRAAAPQFGSITFEVTNATASGSVEVNVLSSEGSLALGPNGALYTAYLQNSGKIFVKTPALVFILDPARGRIETGLPPILGDTGGVPAIYENGIVTPGNPALMVAGNNPLANIGELVETKFRVNTRDPQAGVTLPTNQGRIAVDLFQNGYVRVGAPAADIDGLGNGTLLSPLQAFGVGAVGSRRGILVASGTDTVFGPDNNEGSSMLVPYYRVSVLSSIQQPAGTLEPSDTTTPLQNKHYVQPIPARAPRYQFDYDLHPDPDAPGDPYQAFLKFDAPGENAIGLLARRTDEGRPGIAEKFLEATYLWQNNYARNPANGMPLDKDGNEILIGSAARPEPDAVKVDYATRSLLNIGFGARIYDTSQPQPYSITISDKVQVNNVGR